MSSSRHPFLRLLGASSLRLATVSGLGLAAAAGLAQVAIAGPQAGMAPAIEPSRRPDAVVVTYRELQGEIGGTERGPVLTVYGDGRVVSHYPVFMKRAGDWEHRLAPGELDALLRSLADKGVLDFDAQGVRAAARSAAADSVQRARAANTPVVLFETSDASTTVIEVTVDRYVAATPGAHAVQGFTKRVAWTGVRGDAERHRGVSALQNLAAAEQELRALRDRPGAARVR